MPAFKLGNIIVKLLEKNLNNITQINHEKSDECYCGNTYGSYGNATSQGKLCNYTCTKNNKETCGGEFANSIYQINSSCFSSTSTSTIYTQSNTN
jgi:hypothetical protein